MSDYDSDDGDDDVSFALARVRRRIQVDGARTAVEALIEVCRDKKAPAPARATAGASLLRAAGLFASANDGPEKEPHEMDGHELAAAVRRAQRNLAALGRERAALEAGGSSDSVFD